jgi:hypothetical protein
MTEKAFDAVVLEVHFLGIHHIKLSNNEKKVLLYFTRDVDSVEAPLSISEDQAKQLYNDLKSLFTEYTT